MRKLYSILLCAMLFMISCKSCKTEFEVFQNEALEYGDDSKISSAELEKLFAHIGSYPKERDFKTLFYTSNKLDSTKVLAYLNKLYSSQNIRIDELRLNDGQNTKSSKFNINVYLENSASMDGYVNGATDFKDAIYSMLGDISLSAYCDSLNLNYINATIPYTKKQAKAEEVRSFIHTLTPETFSKRGGNRSSSNLKHVIQHVLSRTDEKNASVLISDFVFSPGQKVDAHDYLASESIGIKIDVANKLQDFELSVLVLQLDSKFRGFYYDQVDHPTWMDDKRPYYIWIIGNSAQLKNIIESGLTEKIRGGYRHKVLFQSIKQEDRPDYKILYTGKVGNFHLPEGAHGPITNAEVSDLPRTVGKFTFNVAIDFSRSLQDASFFTDSTNYDKNSTYRLSSAKINDQTDVSLQGFTHVIKMTTTNLKKEPINISVKGHIPQWVVRSSSENDLRTIEQDKTFGLKYLIEGLSNAFYPPDKNTISKVEILIN